VKVSTTVPDVWFALKEKGWVLLWPPSAVDYFCSMWTGENLEVIQSDGFRESCGGEGLDVRALREGVREGKALSFVYLGLACERAAAKLGFSSVAEIMDPEDAVFCAFELFRKAAESFNPYYHEERWQSYLESFLVVALSRQFCAVLDVRRRERVDVDPDLVEAPSPEREMVEVRRMALLQLGLCKYDSGIKTIFLASVKSAAAAEKVRMRLEIPRPTAFYKICQLCTDLVLNLRQQVTLI
jgi:hypothetical protein